MGPSLTCSANSSEISLSEYHEYSDNTMEGLLDSLEDLLDGISDPDYEVEYSVRDPMLPHSCSSCAHLCIRISGTRAAC